MSDENKTKAQLIAEQADLRRQVAELSVRLSKLQKVLPKLRDSEELYRTLFENAQLGIGVADAEGNLIAFNDAMLHPGGYSRDDIAEIKNVARLYYDANARDRILETAQKRGLVHRQEVQFKRKDGTPYDTLLSLTPVHLAGKPGWQAVFEDITERKQMEEQLRQAKARAEAVSAIAVTATQATSARLQEIETLFTAAQAVLGAGSVEDICQILISHFNSLVQADRTTLFLVNHEHRTIQVNMVYGNFDSEIAMTYEELEAGISGAVFKSGQPVLSLRLEDEPEATRERRLQDDVGSLVVIPLIAKDGDGRPVVIGTITTIRRPDQESFTEHEVDLLMTLASHAATTIENVRLFETTQHEIAERKQAEEALRKSEHMYRQLFDEAPIGILSADTEGNILMVNSAALSMLGSPSEEATKNINLLTFPLLVEAGIADDFRHCVAKRTTIVTERPYTSNWGKAGYFRLHSTPIRDLNGRIDSFQILVEDITERKEGEAVLKRQNRLLETVNDMARIISTTLDTRQILHAVAQATAQAIEATSVYICDWEAEQGTSTVLAEHYSAEASDLERQSDLGASYTLVDDFGDTANWLRTAEGFSIVHVDDPQIHPNERAHLEQYGGLSTLYIALRTHGKVIGYIEIWESRRKREFTLEEIELVQAIAHQAAATIENAQLYQRVKEQQEYHRALLDAIPELIFHLNADGIFIDYRAEDTQDLLLSPDHFLSQHFQSVLPAQLSQQLMEAINAATQTGQIQSFEYALEIPGNALQTFEARIASTKMGTTVVVSRNITARKQAETDRLMLVLEQEKADLLRQFISHLSHDLKTPLSIIRINLDILQRISDPQKQKKSLEVINQQSKRLAQLIHDILTVSRLDHQPNFMFEAVDLNDLVNDVAAELRSLAEQKSLLLRTELDPNVLSVWVDKDELERALINLVENAVAYTEQGVITIRTQRQAGNVVAEVVDGGIGISEAQLPYIFDHFYRADQARSIHDGGSGLGLAIAQKIVEGHGGSIEAQSEEGKGSIFRILLPSV